MNSLNEIANVLKKSHRIILSGHVMPDGDSLGSVMALGLALESLGKEVFLLSPDPIPSTYLFLPFMERFKVVDEALKQKADTFIVLDCSVPERLAGLKELLNKSLVINLDHHFTNQFIGAYNYIDPKASATGEIVMDLILELGVSLSKEIATFLYVAINTDTGRFCYDNATSNTFRRVASLLEAGIDTSFINTNLYEQKPLVALKVLKLAINNLRLSSCGKVAWTFITMEDMNSLGALNEHAEDLVDKLRGIKGVEIAVCIKEMPSGRFKISFRSKGKANVCAIANKFGGGGHIKAAGCVLEPPLKDIEARVINTALQQLQKIEK